VTRAEGDSWDIATSVGSTAVMVAAARAAETASEKPLIQDRFAQVLTETPELSGLLAKMSATWANDSELGNIYQHMVDYQAARTHFARLSSVMAGLDDGLRGRPAQGAGVQVGDVEVARRAALRSAP
jgi:hypothetical protein